MIIIFCPVISYVDSINIEKTEKMTSSSVYLTSYQNLPTHLIIFAIIFIIYYILSALLYPRVTTMIINFLALLIYHKNDIYIQFLCVKIAI